MTKNNIAGTGFINAGQQSARYPAEAGGPAAHGAATRATTGRTAMQWIGGLTGRLLQRFTVALDPHGPRGVVQTPVLPCAPHGGGALHQPETAGIRFEELPPQIHESITSLLPLETRIVLATSVCHALCRSLKNRAVFDKALQQAPRAWSLRNLRAQLAEMARSALLPAQRQEVLTALIRQLPELPPAEFEAAIEATLQAALSLAGACRSCAPLDAIGAVVADGNNRVQPDTLVAIARAIATTPLHDSARLRHDVLRQALASKCQRCIVDVMRLLAPDADACVALLRALPPGRRQAAVQMLLTGMRTDDAGPDEFSGHWAALLSRPAADGQHDPAAGTMLEMLAAGLPDDPLDADRPSAHPSDIDPPSRGDANFVDFWTGPHIARELATARHHAQAGGLAELIADQCNSISASLYYPDKLLTHAEKLVDLLQLAPQAWSPTLLAQTLQLSDSLHLTMCRSDTEHLVRRSWALLESVHGARLTATLQALFEMKLWDKRSGGAPAQEQWSSAAVSMAARIMHQRSPVPHRRRWLSQLLDAERHLMNKEWELHDGWRFDEMRQALWQALRGLPQDAFETLRDKILWFPGLLSVNGNRAETLAWEAAMREFDTMTASGEPR